MSEPRTAIVTAGGSGMGAEAARVLAEEGYRIAILSSSGKGESLAAELGGFGVTGSNQSIEDLKHLVDGALHRWGKIDAVVNSAGHGPKGDVLEMTDDDWHAGLDVYLLNVVRVTRLVTPHLVSGGGGTIINISTFAAFEPDPDFPTSAVFRSGLAGFTKLFSDRYAHDNVRMNNVLPGYIDNFAVREEKRAKIPLGRYGRVNEIGKTIAFLASEGAGYITGQNIRVDGGLTRSV